VRFEFRAWKRILQTDPKAQWFPKKATAEQVFARVYREDARAQDNWETVCTRKSVSAAAVPEDVSGREGLRNEYLQQTLVPSTVYAVSQPFPVECVVGAPEAEREVYFHLLEMAYGNRRPDFLSVADPGADVALQAGMALLVVWLHRRAPAAAAAADDGDDQGLLHFDSAPQWVRPGDICPLNFWYSKLYKWTVAGADVEGNMIVHNPKVAYCPLPYTHELCPTVAIAWKLKRLGWRPLERLCDHNTNAIVNFDAFPAVRMKFYYQVLLSLGRCLDLASHIPSRQPQLFYKLLLAGKKAEPGLGNQEYIVQWKAFRKDGPVLELPLEPPSPEHLPDPIEDLHNDDILMPGLDDDGAANKRRKSCAFPGIGHGKAPGRPPLPPPPVPPLPLPPPVVAPPIIVPPPQPGTPPPQPGTPPLVDPPPPLDDDVVLGSDTEEAPPRAPPVGRRGDKWFNGPLGCRLRYDPDYVTPGGVRFSANWQIKCPNPLHKSCYKKKHVSAESTAECGENQPLAFLHLWAEMEPRPGEKHSLMNPETEEVVVYAAAYARELGEAFAMRPNAGP